MVAGIHTPYIAEGGEQSANGTDRHQQHRAELSNCSGLFFKLIVLVSRGRKKERKKEKKRLNVMARKGLK